MSADRGEDHHSKLNSDLIYTCLQTEAKDHPSQLNYELMYSCLQTEVKIITPN
jgi:hypothetical protein